MFGRYLLYFISFLIVITPFLVLWYLRDYKDLKKVFNNLVIRTIISFIVFVLIDIILALFIGIKCLIFLLYFAIYIGIAFVITYFMTKRKGKDKNISQIKKVLFINFIISCSSIIILVSLFLLLFLLDNPLHIIFILLSLILITFTYIVSSIGIFISYSRYEAKDIYIMINNNEVVGILTDKPDLDFYGIIEEFISTDDKEIYNRYHLYKSNDSIKTDGDYETINNILKENYYFVSYDKETKFYSFL